MIRDILEDIGGARTGTGVEVVPVMSLLLFGELCLVLYLLLVRTSSSGTVVVVDAGVVASFFQIVRWWLFVAAALEIYAHNTTCVISLSLCFCALLCPEGCDPLPCLCVSFPSLALFWSSSQAFCSTVTRLADDSA